MLRVTLIVSCLVSLLPSTVALAQTQDPSGTPSTSTAAHTEPGAGDGASAASSTAPSSRSVGGTTLAERNAADAERHRAREDEDEDDGRKADLLWIEGGFGYSYVNLAQFSQSNFIPGIDQYKGSGYVGHVAAGFRLFFLTLGARGTIAAYPDLNFDLWSVMADVALRLPIPIVEPYVRLGVGYAFMGSADYARPADSSVSVYGLTIEGGVGVDIYLNPYLSIGGGLDVVYLNLTRQRVDRCESSMSPDCRPGDVNFEESGDAVGLQMRLSGHLALHF